jgi:hypothetical protein
MIRHHVRPHVNCYQIISELSTGDLYYLQAMDFAREVVKALEVPHTEKEGSSGRLQFVSVSLGFD